MAQYNYEGSMAAYFLLTFISLILFPLTFSFRPSLSSKPTLGCNCDECVRHRRDIHNRDKRSILRPQFTIKGVITIIGWIAFAGLTYIVINTDVETKLYNPFEILGIKEGATEKEIKRHFKRISLKFHPDTVKLAVNQTIEHASAYFVDLTKAYKALTDETIRQNWELYNHPDGKQEMNVGIALPKWVVESQNSGWVLGIYALGFGGLLPYLVGKWWFGQRTRTKDGVRAETAEVFFRELKEEAEWQDLVGVMGKGLAIEETSYQAQAAPVEELAKQIDSAVGPSWRKAVVSESLGTKRALALLYAHLLRLPVQNSVLAKEQTDLLLLSPPLLGSLLSMALSHNWLSSTLEVMHLHTYLAQALLPSRGPLLQFASVTKEDTVGIETQGETVPLDSLVQKLASQQDPRAKQLKEVSKQWGKLDVVDAQFKVLGERLVTPGAIVQLVFKVRLLPAGVEASPFPAADVDQEKAEARREEEREQLFMQGKSDMETLDGSESGYAHAPYWPANRRPQWWAMIGDQKLNRVIVPPMKFKDVPFYDSATKYSYRIYKLQFQAPPNTGLYTFQIHFVSDTFVGEDVRRDIMLRVDDVSALNDDEKGAEDEISDPEEDSLAGQMAAMRGGSVKKIDDDDDESTTDGDESSDSDSSSDSD